MFPPPRNARVDFHLHSYASNVTDYYAANAFSIPESYSDPKVLYAALKARGMDLVTLTDHNAISGVQELLDLGHTDVFISSEITTTFPEDGCRIHVTVANMTEAQFREIDRLRPNVYEFIAYLDQQIAEEKPDGNRIAYFMTHPLMSTQNRAYGREGSLRMSHIERMFLLCPAFEVQNGARTRALNELTLQMIQALDPARIERLANTYDLAPKGASPWHKGMIGGSDDHAGINHGTTWTEFPYLGERPSPNGLIDCIRHAETRPGGIHGGPITLAHALLKLLHDGSERRQNAATPAFAGPTRDLLRLLFSASSTSVVDKLIFQAKATLHKLVQAWQGPQSGRRFEDVLNDRVYALLDDEAFRTKVLALTSTDDRIFFVLNTLLNGIFASYFDSLLGTTKGNLVMAIKEMVALVASNVFVSLPYLVAFLQQSSDCLIVRDVRREFAFAAPERLALVTDTFTEVNGVTGTIRRVLRESMRRGIDLTVLICLDDAERVSAREDAEVAGWIDTGKLKVFPALRSLGFPEYEGLRVRFPPFLEMLRYMQEMGFTKVQISTPGTVGVAGMLVAKVLQLETASTYHTSFPEYVESYTRDLALEAMAWKYMVGFYHAVDEVIVPCRYIAKLLHKRGLRKRKLLVLDRWVDTHRFRPDRADPTFWTKLGVPEGVTRFIYVGRLGAEKNLALMATAFRTLYEERRDIHMMLVGDGPFRAELQRQLDGLPVTFTGFLGGDALVTALASADVKLFPSTTDTWGNAPLEAQAAGLPVIVSNVGGPRELMIEGETGLVVGGYNARELTDAMRTLLDPGLRGRMAIAARLFAVSNQVPQPFTAILDSNAYRASLSEAHPSRSVVTAPADDAELAT